jgi:hypothetical protein
MRSGFVACPSQALKMKVDKRKFDAVLGKMLKAGPQKRSEMKPERKLIKAKPIKRA